MSSLKTTENQDFPGGTRIRICLPTQGTRARSLVQEEPTYPGATKPRAATAKPTHGDDWSPRAWSLCFTSGAETVMRSRCTTERGLLTHGAQRDRPAPETQCSPAQKPSKSVQNSRPCDHSTPTQASLPPYLQQACSQSDTGNAVHTCRRVSLPCDEKDARKATGFLPAKGRTATASASPQV